MRLGPLILAMGLSACAPPQHTQILGRQSDAGASGSLAAFIDKPELIDYEVIKEAFLETKCMTCHSLNGKTPDPYAIAYSANLTDYASLFNVFTPVVVKGRPEESKLFRSTAVTQTMPPTKHGYQPLDGVRLKLIRLWILNCAIESKAALADEKLLSNSETPEKVRDCEAG